MVSKYLDKITCGDCLEVMPQLPDASVNLIILDLPYNIKKADWDKINDYLVFVGAIFKECERVLKDNGSLYWFHNDFNTIVDVYARIRDSKFLFRQLITWDKSAGATTGFSIQRLSNGTMRNYYDGFTEYILYFTFQDETGLSQIYGNDDCFKPIKGYMQQEKQKAGLKTCKQINKLLCTAHNCGGMASHYFSTMDGYKQWGFPTKEMYEKLQTTGYFQRDYEDINQEYEDLRRDYEDLRYRFNVQNVLALPYGNSNVWLFGLDKDRNHITQKPVKLIENIIEHSTNDGDIVLDPTAGSGTTAVACKRSDRHYICIEKEEEYVKIARNRVNSML